MVNIKFVFVIIQPLYKATNKSWLIGKEKLEQIIKNKHQQSIERSCNTSPGLRKCSLAWYKWETFKKRTSSPELGSVIDRKI